MWDGPSMDVPMNFGQANMTNAGSASFDPSSAPRRSSYASVAAGLAGSSQYPTQASPNQTVSLADIMNPLSPSAPLSAAFLEHRRRTDLAPGISSFLGQRRRLKETGDSSQVPYDRGFGRIPQGLAWENGLSLPSYLRSSRYGVQLRYQQSRREQIPQEKSSTYHTNNGGSANSSSVSLPRLQPSSRGMTYDVVEPELPFIDELPLLPSRWSDTDKNESLELHSEGHEVKYVQHGRNDYEAAAIRTDRHIPPACGVYYYEVTISSKGRDG